MLALAAGGWGSVMAAALCPHAQLDAAYTGTLSAATTDNACHSAKPETVAKPDCHDSAATEQEATAVAEVPGTAPRNRGDRRTLSIPENVPCTHCIGRPELPSSTVMARQQGEQKRSLEPAPAQATSPATPAPSFTQPVLYRQGAPPGSTTPKHLLISVLVI